MNQNPSAPVFLGVRGGGRNFGARQVFISQTLNRPLWLTIGTSYQNIPFDNLPKQSAYDSIWFTYSISQPDAKVAAVGLHRLRCLVSRTLFAKSLNKMLRGLKVSCPLIVNMILFVNITICFKWIFISIVTCRVGFWNTWDNSFVF